MSEIADPRADRARANFAALLDYKREGERRRIPEVIREIWAERQWEPLGYSSYGAACAAILGEDWRNPWPVEERREVVAELASAGMSARNIASAVGVSHPTVLADMHAGGKDLPPVTGEDGKTYQRTRPARVTTVTETTEHVVDLATGEILGEEVTSEVWEAERGPTITQILAADSEVREANRRYELSKWISGAHAITTFDPAEMARIAPDMAERVAGVVAYINRFADLYAASIAKPTPLHIIKEA